MSSITDDPRASQVPPDDSSFTMARLREMGVSFINKDDLLKNSRRFVLNKTQSNWIESYVTI